MSPDDPGGRRGHAVVAQLRPAARAPAPPPRRRSACGGVEGRSSPGPGPAGWRCRTACRPLHAVVLLPGVLERGQLAPRACPAGSSPSPAAWRGRSASAARPSATRAPERTKMLVMCPSTCGMIAAEPRDFSVATYSLRVVHGGGMGDLDLDGRAGRHFARRRRAAAGRPGQGEGEDDGILNAVAHDRRKTLTTKSGRRNAIAPRRRDRRPEGAGPGWALANAKALRVRSRILVELVRGRA